MTRLKLTLAMGGGTSQGTFSGIGLTEALKLLLLYGDGGRPLEAVEIDSMSGASAGTVTLAILLRGLLQPIPPPEEERLVERLARLYGADFTRIAPDAPVRRKLVHAQAAQELQRELWVEQTHIEALLSGDKDERKHDAGLLARRLLDDLARRYLSAEGADLREPPLLASRVLFFAALANLSPIVYHAESDLPAARPAGSAALSDSLTSRGHRDERVFDLTFDRLASADPGLYPESWFRCHAGSEAERPRLFDLRRSETWGAIAATSIASAAFPFGFAPVSLTRYAWEYGGLWPEPLATKGVDRYPFTYVDGGTFNNEPLREAFRLGAFLDGEGEEDSERVVLFVDPNVSSLGGPAGLRVPILRQFGDDGQRLPTLGRLGSHIGTMVGALRDEAALSAENRRFHTRRVFELRDEQREALRKSLVAEAGPLSGSRAEALEDLLASARTRLERLRAESRLPGSLLSVPAELERVAREEKGRFPALASLRGKALAFADSADPASDPAAGLWLYVAHCVSLDMALGLEGRSPTTIVPLAPLWKPADPGSVFDLPNEAVGTFAGFLSPTAQCFTVDAALYCTRQFLVASRLVPEEVGAALEKPLWTGAHEGAFRREVQAGLEPLLERLNRVIDDGVSLPIVDVLAAKAVMNRVKKGIEEGLARRSERREQFELRLALPPGLHVRLVDPKDAGRRTLPPDRLGGARLLVGTGEYVWDKESGAAEGWRATTGDRLEVRFPAEQAGVFCRIDLPPDDLVEQAALMANPVFELDLTEADGAVGNPGLVGAVRWRVRDDIDALDGSLFARPGGSLNPRRVECGPPAVRPPADGG